MKKLTREQGSIESKAGVPFRSRLKRSPQWVRTIAAILVLAGAFSITSCRRTASAGETVYDNTHRGIRNGSDAFFPQRGDWFLAQPFNIGDHDNVSSVTINFARFGDTTGTADFSIWDDNGNGIPRQRVAELGTLDLSLLENIEPPISLPPVTFDASVTSLIPNETYYVFADWRNVAGGNPSWGNSVWNAFIPDGSGTNNADHLIVTKTSVGLDWQDNDWVSLASFGFGHRWLQMSVESTPTGVPGDFNNSGTLDSIDVDMLSAEIVAGTDVSTFDLTRDNVVDTTDLTTWLSDAAEYNGFSEAYLLGDSNLDGSVNSTDLNNLALNWQRNVALWSGGDFTPDGMVNSTDLNALAINWRQSIPTASAVIAPVPEPSAWLLALFGLPLVWRRPRRN